MVFSADAGVGHRWAATGAVREVVTALAEGKVAQGDASPFPEANELGMASPDLPHIVLVDAA